MSLSLEEVKITSYADGLSLIKAKCSIDKNRNIIVLPEDVNMESVTFETTEGETLSNISELINSEDDNIEMEETIDRMKLMYLNNLILVETTEATYGGILKHIHYNETSGKFTCLLETSTKLYLLNDILNIRFDEDSKKDYSSSNDILRNTLYNSIKHSKIFSVEKKENLSSLMANFLTRRIYQNICYYIIFDLNKDIIDRFSLYTILCNETELECGVRELSYASFKYINDSSRYMNKSVQLTTGLRAYEESQSYDIDSERNNYNNIVKLYEGDIKKIPRKSKSRIINNNFKGTDNLIGGNKLICYNKANITDIYEDNEFLNPLITVECKLDTINKLIPGNYNIKWLDKNKGNYHTKGYDNFSKKNIFFDGRTNVDIELYIKKKSSNNSSAKVDIEIKSSSNKNEILKLFHMNPRDEQIGVDIEENNVLIIEKEDRLDSIVLIMTLKPKNTYKISYNLYKKVY